MEGGSQDAKDNMDMDEKEEKSEEKKSQSEKDVDKGGGGYECYVEWYGWTLIAIFIILFILMIVYFTVLKNQDN